MMEVGLGKRAVLGLSIGLALAGVMVVAGQGGAAKTRPAAPGKTFTWSFETDTLGLKPPHSVEFGGSWKVSEDSTEASRILTQTDGGEGIAFNYLTFTRPLLEDLDASVRFRIRSGEMDPSAGLLFQMDPKGTSGYLVRVSGGKGELAFHYLLYGKRRDVKYAKVNPPAPGTWHTLAIQRRRSALRVTYDGKELMTVRDDRFSKGNVGLWAEDDTSVDFVDLTATAR